ncbi:hypothetical protein GCM10020220_023760 [Nonomuraea rubra]
MDADERQPVGALLDGQPQCGMTDRLPGGLLVAGSQIHGVLVHGWKHIAGCVARNLCAPRNLWVECDAATGTSPSGVPTTRHFPA